MELNPNHPVTREVSDHWHKICAVLLGKMCMSHVVLTVEDIERVSGAAIAIEGKPDGLHVRLMSMAEAERLARKEGGLPI